MGKLSSQEIINNNIAAKACQISEEQIKKAKVSLSLNPQSWIEGHRASEAGEIDKGRRKYMTQEERTE